MAGDEKLPPILDVKGRCGSEAGHQAHRKRGERSCGDCLDARKAARKARYRKLRDEQGDRTAPTVDPQGRCGTVAGVQAHYRRNESLCEECSTANREAGREYHRKNPDYYKENYLRNADTLRERSRDYRNENLEACRASYREWYRENREAQVARSLEWGRSNRDKRRASDHRRRSKIAGATVDGMTVDAHSIKMRFEYFGNACWICSSGERLEADHVIPISRGGAHVPANIRPACKSCNSSKGNRWTIDTREGGRQWQDADQHLKRMPLGEISQS